MGNYKFRFSDMIPNAWFHKLKNMNTKPTPNYYLKTLNQSKKKPITRPENPKPDPLFTNSDQRKSYYFTRDLALQPDPPRRSSRRRRSHKRPSPRATSACTCGGGAAAVWAGPDDSSASGPDQTSSSEPESVVTEYGSDGGSGHDISTMSWPGQSPCKVPCRGLCKGEVVINICEDDDECRRRLPPIITRAAAPPPPPVAPPPPVEFSCGGSPVRRRGAGMRLRVNSPRIGRRRSVSSNSSSAASTRRSITESMAVVKASKDPRRDFRESMVEMIMENDIRASNDLEELLACYLSLNSDEYHELIINVFKQIWFEFIHLRLK